jgi:hypothetical protein
MRQRIAVTTDDGTTLEVVALPPDFVAWERHSKRRISELGDSIGMEDLLYLAWSASRREVEQRPPFDVWMQKVTDAELLDDPEPAPTRPAASATP